MSAQPQRIQLSRRKGWRMPANTVVVSRPSKWGNPWTTSERFGAADVVAFYESWMTGDYDSSVLPNRPDVRELRGKNLACWCKPGEPCHADVLLELANA